MQAQKRPNASGPRADTGFPSPLKTATGDDSLSQRQPAIVRRNPAMNENFKTAFPEERQCVSQQTKVLERSAAQADPSQTMGSTNAPAAIRDNARHRQVEARGNFAGRDAVDDVADNGPDNGPQIDTERAAVFDRERVGAGGGCRRHFELNRGLSFVRGFM